MAAPAQVRPRLFFPVATTANNRDRELAKKEGGIKVFFVFLSLWGHVYFVKNEGFLVSYFESEAYNKANPGLARQSKEHRGITIFFLLLLVTLRNNFYFFSLPTRSRNESAIL